MDFITYRNVIKTICLEMRLNTGSQFGKSADAQLLYVIRDLVKIPQFSMASLLCIYLQTERQSGKKGIFAVRI